MQMACGRPQRGKGGQSHVDACWPRQWAKNLIFLWTSQMYDPSPDLPSFTSEFEPAIAEFVFLWVRVTIATVSWFL